MKNKKIMTITAAATGVVSAGMVSTNVHADTIQNAQVKETGVQGTQNQTKTTPVQQKQEQIKNTQTAVDNQQKVTNQAQTTMNNASDAYHKAQTSASQAQANVQKAQANVQSASKTAEQATPANIQKNKDEQTATENKINTDKTNIANQQKVVTTAQSNVNTAQNNVNTAQNNVNTAQNKFNQAKANLDDAQHGMTKAQQAVDQQKQVVNHDQQLVNQSSQAVQNDTNKVNTDKTAVQNATIKVNQDTTAVQNAQNKVNTTQDKVNTDKANVQSATTKVNQVQDQLNKDKQALQNIPTIGMNPDAQLVNGHFNQDKFNEVDKGFHDGSISMTDYYKGLADLFGHEGYNPHDTYQGIEQSTHSNPGNFKILPDADQVVDVTNGLTDQQIQDINQYSGSLINEIRKEYDPTSPLVQISPKSIAMAKEETEITDQDGCWDDHDQHAINQVYGKTFYSVDLSPENLQPQIVNPYDPSQPITMAEVYQQIYESLLMMLDRDADQGNGHSQSLMGADAISRNITQEYLGVSVDNHGGIHFNMYGFGPKSVWGMKPEDLIQESAENATTPDDFNPETLQKKVANDEDALSNATNGLDTVTSQLNTDEASLQQAQSDLSNAKTALDNSQQQLTNAKNQLTNDETQLTKDSTTNKMDNITLSKDQDTLTKLENDINHPKQYLADMQKQYDTAKTNLDKANQDLQTKKDALAKATKAYNDANNKLNELKNTLTNDEKQLSNLEQQGKDYQNAKSNLQKTTADLNTATAALNSAEKNMQEKKQALDTATKAYNDANNKLTSLKNELSNEQQELDKMTTKEQKEQIKKDAQHQMINNIVDTTQHKLASTKQISQYSNYKAYQWKHGYTQPVYSANGQFIGMKNLAGSIETVPVGVTNTMDTSSDMVSNMAYVPGKSSIVQSSYAPTSDVNSKITLDVKSTGLPQTGDSTEHKSLLGIIALAATTMLTGIAGIKKKEN